MADTAMERDFEKPIIELEKRIEELESFSRKAGVDLTGEIAKLRERANQEKKDIFARLNAWPDSPPTTRPRNRPVPVCGA